MGTVRHLTGLSQLEAALKRDMRAVRRKVVQATQQTARLGAGTIAAQAPVAFGSLRESVKARNTSDGARIVASAPHAAALEVGSRPHWPPLGPLEAWVKLRGMQGLNAGATARGSPGAMAAAIAARGTSTSTPINAPRQIAFLIARAISVHGTKPHWYVRSALPEIRTLLNANVVQNLKNEPLT